MACPEAAVGWGVPLTNGLGYSPHPSIRHLIEAGSRLLDPEPQGEHEEYWRHLSTEEAGYIPHPRSAPAVFLDRTVSRTCDSEGRVDLARLAPPTDAELGVLTRYLDEAGFTGDRTVRLLLIAWEV